MTGPQWAIDAKYDGRVDRAEDPDGSTGPLYHDEDTPPTYAYAVPLLPAEESCDGESGFCPDLVGVVVMHGGEVGPESERRGELAESLRAMGVGPKPHSTKGRYLLEACGLYRSVLLLGLRPTATVLRAASCNLLEAERLRGTCTAMGLADADAILLMRASVLAAEWHDRVVRAVGADALGGICG